MFRALLVSATLLVTSACVPSGDDAVAQTDPCASGEDALTSGEAVAAISAFEACLATASLDPEQEAIIHTRLGGAYLYEDRYEEALQAFNLAYAIAETQGVQFENPYVRRNRGISRLAVGQLNGALDDLEVAVLDLPDDIMTRLNLGRTYSQLGREAEAVAAFDAVTRIEPEWSGGWVNLSASLLELGVNDQAIDHARRAVELEPESGFTLNALCWSLIVDAQHATALPLCEQAVAAEPGNGAIVHSLASALEGVGRVEEARSRFSEAYSLMPESETIEMDYLRTRAEND
jgi:tetratricopeptide (TPR) repeat protein